ncbi:hypothetical protein FACS1894110_11590 [Spirochaetia bacterium]|nr:hypothetical protein FACS1894110_11590 [Spirochaetia bacterium]
MAKQSVLNQPQRGLTFDDVWAALMETRAHQEETGRLVKELTKNMGGLNNRMGELVEHLVSSGILNRFKELGYTFDKMSRDTVVIGPNGDRREVDMELHNGRDIMLIEIKAKPAMDDIDDHAERITFLKNLGKYQDNNVYGAIAGAVFPANVKTYALKSGFYVIEQSGDTVRIETLGGTFKGKKW